MAVLDLPDPTQPPPTVNTGATDDLLSQLAGDEIDRLLAEADVEPDESRPRHRDEVTIAAPAADVAIAPGSQRRSSAAPSSLPASSTGEVFNASSPPAELGALLDTLSSPQAQSDASSTTPAPFSITPPPVAVAPPGSDSAAIVAAELETSDAERNALRGGVMPSPAPAAEAEALEFDADAESSVSLPIVLRPLEWLNAPFAGADEQTRDTMGTLALITLINAIGVLVYVFFFRRH